MWWYTLAVFSFTSIAFVAGVFVGLSSERSHIVQPPSLDRLSALSLTARN